MRILVADDHEVSRKGVCSILSSRSDIQVCAEASDGDEAIEKMLVVKPDMVILDFSMPTLDGLSATRKIKQILPTVPIIILSMHNGPQIMQAAQLDDRVVRKGVRVYFVTSPCYSGDPD